VAGRISGLDIASFHPLLRNGRLGNHVVAGIMTGSIDHLRLAAFVRSRAGVPLQELQLNVRPLTGGLESAGVARVAASYVEGDSRRKSLVFVVKKLTGGGRREADALRLIGEQLDTVAPRLLHYETLPDEGGMLFLESVRRTRAWPWRDREARRKVVQRLAELHTIEWKKQPDSDWDYEKELTESAASTIGLLEQLPGGSEFAAIRRGVPAVRRVAGRLETIRRELLDEAPLGRTMIHGDAHPGNAMLRIRDRAEVPVLIDWGRTRIGSPLEDVSSWLQTLAFWEPEARRDHDEQLRNYLDARGLGRRIPAAIRRHYWMAAACNVLAGALRYHVATAMNTPDGSRQRIESLALSLDCLRMIRRADAVTA
jgi:aminoglycoside phosphotransferase (APT) family kinase protein